MWRGRLALALVKIQRSVGEVNRVLPARGV
jgi:hypothetical protein